MSFPVPTCEAFFINPLSGDVFVQSMAKYAPAEKLAAELFRRPMPDTLKGKAAYVEDCARYVQDHTELAECPRFAPKLATRFDQLQTQLKSCTDGLQALRIAREAKSMVASLAMRLAPAGTVTIKTYGTPPGNIPEMLDFLDYPYDVQAKAVDLMRPDALEIITALFSESLETLKKFHRDSHFGPSPDALIVAAEDGRSFDSVRQKMLQLEVSASLHDDSHYSCFDVDCV